MAALIGDGREASGAHNFAGAKKFLEGFRGRTGDAKQNAACIFDSFSRRLSLAVFDLPEEIAKELLTKQLPPGNTLSKITKLPALQDDGPSSDNYGRFSNRDRFSRGGSRDNDRFSRGGSRDKDRFSRGGSRDNRGFRASRGGWSSDEEGGYRRGGRSSRTENSWSKFSKSSGDDWLIGGRRSSSPPSRDRFGGSCFNCGRSGHRASECPNKEDY